MPAKNTTGLRAGNRCLLAVNALALLALLAARPVLGCDTNQFTWVSAFDDYAESNETNAPATAAIEIDAARSAMSAATDGSDDVPGVYATGEISAPNADGIGEDHFEAMARSETHWVFAPNSESFEDEPLWNIASARLTAAVEGVLQAEAADPNMALAHARGNLALHTGSNNSDLGWTTTALNMTFEDTLPAGDVPALHYDFMPSNAPYPQWFWHEFSRELTLDVDMAPQQLTSGELDPRSMSVRATAFQYITGTIQHNLTDYWIRAAAKAGMTYTITAVDADGNAVPDVTAYLVTPPAAIAWADATEIENGQLLLTVHMDESDRPEYTVPTRGESIMWFYSDTNGNGTFEEAEDGLLGADTSAGDGWSLPTGYATDDTGTFRFFAVAENACGEKSEYATAEISVEPETPLAVGTAIANLGDLDGDGFDDIAVSAPGFENRGKVEVYSGQSLEPMFEKTGRGQGDQFGYALAGIADLDGDGVRDILIGAPFESLAGLAYCGSVEILSGADGSRIAIRRGAFAGEMFGFSIDAGRDLNSDGTEDFIVGAPGASRGAEYYAGAIYLHSGADLSRLRRILGKNQEDYLGYAVTLLEDFDGDGRADFAAGAPGNADRGMYAGRFTVWSGQSGRPMFHRRGAHAFDFCGLAMSDAGDLDGDGIGDLVVGTPGYDTAAGEDVGKIAAWNFLGQAIWNRGGQHEGGELGTAIERLGDLNCDGIDDIAAGAPNANIVQLFSGDDRALIGELAPGSEQDRLGYGTALAWFGNLADAAGWLFVGAPDLDNGDVDLEIVATCGTDGLPGDLNDDGAVDLLDMAILIDNYGCIGGDCIGDLNGNGFVDEADIFLMQLYLGEAD